MSIKMVKSGQADLAAPPFAMVYRDAATTVLRDGMSPPLSGQVMRSMTETLLEIGAKGGLGKRSAKRGRRK